MFKRFQFVILKEQATPYIAGPNLEDVPFVKQAYINVTNILEKIKKSIFHFPSKYKFWLKDKKLKIK